MSHTQAEVSESAVGAERLGVAQDQRDHPEAVRTAQAQPTDASSPPVVQVINLDGGYACAVISQAQDPEAPNIAEIVKVRTVVATDVVLLQPRITACLISEFGMTQEEAEAVVPQDIGAARREQAQHQAQERHEARQEQRQADRHERVEQAQERREEPQRRAGPPAPSLRPGTKA